MKTIMLVVRVEVDDDVMPKHLVDLLSNQLPMNPVTSVGDARIHWRTTKVRVASEFKPIDAEAAHCVEEAAEHTARSSRG